MTSFSPSPYEVEPSRSAYGGMVVAAPFAAAAWLLVLCGVLFVA